MKWFDRIVQSPATGGAQLAMERVSPSDFHPTEQQVQVIDRYADVPAYQRLLTGGDDPVYRLSPEQQDKLIATDIGGKRVNVICAAMPESQLRQFQWQVRALKGELRAKGYQIAQELVATQDENPLIDLDDTPFEARDAELDAKLNAELDAELEKVPAKA